MWGGLGFNKLTGEASLRGKRRLSYDIGNISKFGLLREKKDLSLGWTRDSKSKEKSAEEGECRTSTGRRASILD